MFHSGRRRLAAVCCTLQLTMAGSLHAEGAKVRIATEGGFPPWNATDPAGRLMGFEPDLAMDLCRRMAVACEVVAQDWEGMIPALLAGRYDAIMAGMGITAERLKAISFAGPYANEPSMFAARDGAPFAALSFERDRVDLGTLEPAERRVLGTLAAALEGKTVGVQVSTIQASLLAMHLPHVRARLYERLDTAALDLEAGRIDALFANRSALNAIGAALPQGTLALFGPRLAGGPLGAGVGVGLRTSDADLKAKFDQAIAEATSDGTVAALAARWFGYDVSVPNTPRRP